jgi:hypothetical protein
MEVYFFVSDKQSSVRAFTSDQTGGNLPTEYAPWRVVKSGRLIHIEAENDPIMVAIARDGFFLMSGTRRRR